MTIDLESLRGFTPGPWRLSGVDVVNGDERRGFFVAVRPIVGRGYA